MKSPDRTQTARPSYHHGDLRQALLLAAKALIAEAGIDNLSLRKLAERGGGITHCGRTTIFQIKTIYSVPLPLRAFVVRHQAAQDTFNDPSLTAAQKFAEYICGYVRFAAENPEEYELMFGRNIWKQKHSTQELLDVCLSLFFSIN